MGKQFLLCWLLLLSSCGAPTDSGPVLQPPSPVGAGPLAPGFYNNEDSTPVLDLIQTARRTLDIEIYQMWDRDVQLSLAEAAERGVRVRVLIDGETSSSCKLFEPPSPKDRADCLAYRALVHRIRETGGAFERFRKEAHCGRQGVSCHQHGKLLIADGSTALVSTGNFNSTNLCNRARNPSRCNRDYSVVSRDPVVLDALNRIFALDLAGEPYDLSALLSAEVAERLTVSPLSLEPLVRFVRSARHSVFVQNQYLNDPDLNAALMEAAQRGLEVQVTTASVCFFGPPDEREEKTVREVYSAFDAAGISSRMFTRSIPVGGMEGYLHSKALLVDGTRAWVGSVNGSTTALRVNREFGLFLQDPLEVGELRDLMLHDHQHEGASTWEESLRCAKDRSPLTFWLPPALAGGL